ncbi:hypothetical protein ACJX0J_042066, partial [Zea mays]
KFTIAQIKESKHQHEYIYTNMKTMGQINLISHGNINIHIRFYNFWTDNTVTKNDLIRLLLIYHFNDRLICIGHLQLGDTAQIMLEVE